MFETPREALLKAENDRLKAENAYLKSAIDGAGMTFTPVGVIEEMSVPKHVPEVRLPLAASVKGKLAEFGHYHVISRLRFARPEDLEVRYYYDTSTIKAHSDYYINELMSLLHRQFIGALATALKD